MKRLKVVARTSGRRVFFSFNSNVQIEKYRIGNNCPLISCSCKLGHDRILEKTVC